jgi:oxalate decarboxylase/phosphoglucose isomerase-like protein (cupin superfamily)
MLARVTLAGLLLSLGAAGQSEKPKVFYFPKPVARTAYQPPMKPVTRLADLKARHRGETQWRELVIDDGNSKAYMMQEAPGTKHPRRLYPDSPAWWAVIEGRVRFEIEKPAGGFEVFEARKGSYVFVPERLIHSLEVVGDEPAIRFEVTLYEATPVFEEKPAESDGSVEYIPVRLSTGLNPLDVPDPDGDPWPSHVNVYDLAKQHEGKPRWSRPAMRKNRVRGNFICGLASAEPALKPGDRGHFHADFAEFWVVMLGELRWIFEGDVENAVVAKQGDIVYAPPKTFHVPQFHGEEGLNCRLTSSTFPSANHIFDVEE